MDVKWTPEQSDVINFEGNNLLVSASAGSGKTTVMIQRIISLIEKYSKTENPLSISDFLVVTFTKASASDMKQKLINSFSKLEQNEFILNQIEKVAFSDISNLHSFCSRLISTYFYEVGVDPAYHIVDDGEASFLKDLALSKLFEEKQKNGDKDFFILFDIFQKKRTDKQLRDLIKRFSDNLQVSIDGDEWINKSIINCYNTNLNENLCANVINSYVSNQIKKLVEKTEKLSKKSRNLDFSNIADILDDLSSELRSINKNNSYIVNAKNLSDLKLKTIPKTDNDDFNNEISNFYDDLKYNLKNFEANFVSTDENEIVFALEKASEIIKKLYSLTREFEKIYDKLKRDGNALDFNDLEHYALKILENDSIRQTLQNKYKYVFVDEYQDINAVQEKIISLVSKKDNRFMVGDVKQSIYRFRFCDPDLFLEKFDLYGKQKGGELIKLNCNFRSDKNILKFVDEVFSDVMTDDFGEYDYKANARFVAGENNLDNFGSVNLCYIEKPKKEKEEKSAKNYIYSVKNHINIDNFQKNSSMVEASLVAKKIKEIKKSRNDVGFGDFAILVASRNDNISEFIDCLKRFDLPVASDQKYDLMTKKHIKCLVNFTKFAVNQFDDIVLFNVLKSEMFNFSDNELAHLREVDKTKRFYELVLDYDFENKLDEKLKEKIINFRETANKYTTLAKLVQIKEFINKVVDDFDFKLLGFAREDGKEVVNDIENFLSALPDVDVFDYVDGYSNSPLMFENDCSGDSVKVMTIHKSKGIEFKFVFLINLSNEFNFKSTYQSVLFNKIYGVGIDGYDEKNRLILSTIAISMIRMVEKRKLVEEQQRLLYVALTRAVEKLFVICSLSKDKIVSEMPTRPKAFADWFVPIIYNELNGKCLDFLNFEKYSYDDLEDIPEKQKFNLDFSEMKSNKKCDWFEYSYDYAKNVPLKNSISKILETKENEYDLEEIFNHNEIWSSAERGTTYHKFLQKINLHKLDCLNQQIDNILLSFSDEEKKFIDKSKIQKIFSAEIFKNIQNSDEILQEREFYAKMPAKLINELASDNDEFILQGIIDLLIIKNDDIWIFDYKTGKIQDDKLAKYKFQIETYAKVCERSLGKKITKKVIIFIDEEKNIEF